MIARLMDLFDGPDSMAPWVPPPCPEPLHDLLPWRAWDEQTELYINAQSHGFVLEVPPFAGIDAETLGALAGVLADAAPVGGHCIRGVRRSRARITASSSRCAWRASRDRPRKRRSAVSGGR